MSKIKNIEFFKVWSPDLAYILGFIIADGYINDHGIYFALKNTDIEILEYIKNKVCPEHIIKNKSQYDSRYHKTYYKACLNIHSVEIVNLLIYRYGILQSKTGSECIPNGLPDCYFGNFLRGYFDGDGYVGSDKSHPLKVDICCASKQFLEEIRSKVGLGYVYPHSKHPVFYLRTSSIDSLKLKEIIYKEPCCFALKRKKDIFDAFTIDNLKYIRLNQDQINYITTSNESRNEIAKKLDINPTTVSRQKRSFGIQRRCIKWTQEELSKLKELLEQGLSLIEIAKILNRNKSEVNRQSKQFKRWKNSWSNEEIQFLQNNRDLARKDISKALGRSERSINSKMMRLGLI